jgi:hypothetical protein
MRCQRDICIPMHTTALFIIAKKEKQAMRPSTDEWINKINKMWYMYTTEYYSARKE